MKEVTMDSRPCTVDGTRFPAAPLTASYEPHEEALMRELAGRMRAAEGAERSALVDEAHAIHELKGLLGARVLTEEERVEVVGLPSEAATETLKLMRELQAKGFEFPREAFEAVAEGQTTLLDSDGGSQARTERVPSEQEMRDDPEPPAWSTPSALAASESAASRLPDFDGETYWRALDHERLGKQLLRVGRQMADGRWHTLAELAAATGDPEASVSARLRDLRKRKFGGHTVNRERLEGGLWRYRLVREQFATPWGEEEAWAA